MKVEMYILSIRLWDLVSQIIIAVESLYVVLPKVDMDKRPQIDTCHKLAGHNHRRPPSVRRERGRQQHHVSAWHSKGKGKAATSHPSAEHTKGKGKAATSWASTQGVIVSAQWWDSLPCIPCFVRFMESLAMWTRFHRSMWWQQQSFNYSNCLISRFKSLSSRNHTWSEG